jgi:hypothetical protein
LTAVWRSLIREGDLVLSNSVQRCLDRIRCGGGDRWTDLEEAMVLWR